MRLQHVVVAVLAALGPGALACGYSPNPESGKLGCSSDGQCPQGYSCAFNTCWKDGHAPDPNAFVGRWVFDSSGKIDESCSAGGTIPSSSVAGDYVDLTAGTSSPLVGSYFCTWNMRFPPSNGTKASIVPGQTCQTTDTTGTMMITLHGDAFDFTTANGQNATMSATFSGQYTTGAPLTCTFKVTGNLTAM